MLVSRAAGLGIASWTHFTGTVSDAWRYYSAMDCLVMPSFYEGLPITLIEAQANGLPCIVSDTVSREVDATGRLTFLPLSASKQSWTSTVSKITDAQNRTSESRAAIQELRSAGFAIGNLKKQLVSAYEREERS